MSDSGIALQPNEWRYAQLGKPWKRNYPPARNLPVSDTLALPLKPQLRMTACYGQAAYFTCPKDKTLRYGSFMPIAH